MNQSSSLGESIENNGLAKVLMLTWPNMIGYLGILFIP
jgi:hypothetical protein